MKARILHILKILVVIAVALVIHFVNNKPVSKAGAGQSTEKNSSVSIEYTRRVFPEAAETVPPKKDTEWHKVLDQSGKQLGSVVLSSPHTDDISGYAGSTPLIIGIDTQGNIAGVILLENMETPGFVQRITEAGFLERWNGTHWQKVSDLKVNTITGATMTSSSVKRTLYRRLSIINPEGTKIKEPEASLHFRWVDAGIIIIPLTGLLLCFTGLRQNKVFRYIQQAVSVLYLGFFTAAAFSLALASSWIIGGIPSNTYMGLIILVILAVAVPTLTGKNFYCFFVCPFGSLQEIVFKLVPWKIKLGAAWIRRLRYVRYALLILLAISLVFGLKLNPNDFEPFSAFRFKMAGISALAIAVISLVLSAGINRPWCSFCCGAGALLDFIKKPTDKITGNDEEAACREE